MVIYLATIVPIVWILLGSALAQHAKTCSHSSTVPNVTLANGVDMPALALGTAPLVVAETDPLPDHPTYSGFLPERAYRSVTLALEAGVRHLDTALVYRSHAQLRHVLGTFFASGELRREDVFITSKVMHPPNGGFGTEDTLLRLDEMTPEEVSAAVRRQFERTLAELGVGYVDLVLLHWPAAWNSGDDLNPARRLNAWRVLEEYYGKGWARAIGVSNFNEHHLEQLMKDGAEVRPMVNQIEASVYLQYDEIMKYCQKNNIILEAYSPLGRGVNKVTKDPVVLAVSAKHEKNAGQIALRYLIQRGYAVAFYSSSEEHLKSNQQIFDFELDEDDMAKLNNLNRQDGTWGVPSPYTMS